MNGKINAAIVGPGNIGTDLMLKLLGSDSIEVKAMVGIFKESDGLKIASEHGLDIYYQGLEPILKDEEIKIIFDATSAKAHSENAPLYKKYNKIAIDLTPASVGPFVVPVVNSEENFDVENINMVTCGGQATVPIIAAINKVADVKYAEIVATISSKSAGFGTRQNIDEFTETTAKALCDVGGADNGKAIIILNPAEPPITMRDTVYAKVKNIDENKISDAVKNMAEKIKKYVPGYRLKAGPLFDDDKVTVIIEVEGEGMYLQKYSGNLDIMTAAAKAAGEKIAMNLLHRSEA